MENNNNNWPSINPDQHAKAVFVSVDPDPSKHMPALQGNVDNWSKPDLKEKLMENIKLTYGDGFAGRSYNLIYNGTSHDLIGTTLGSPEDIIPAKENAKEILKTFYGIHDTSIIDSLNFEWDGTM